MIYPHNFEQKIGFDQIRQLLKGKCLSTLGEERVDEMTFSDNYDEINQRLEQVVEFVRITQEEERYEDCAVMRDIMQKYHIPCDTSLEDWRTDLWRFGYSGDVAINNLSVYMVEALTRAGYSNS